MTRTSVDITKDADELKKKLASLRKEARKMKKLEDQKAAEIRRQEEIRFALAFVEMAKRMRFRDSERTYYDSIAAKLREKQSEQSSVGVPTVAETEH